MKEPRRHEPNPENKEVYNKTYRTYRDLYESLKAMMVTEVRRYFRMKAAVVVANEDVQYQEIEETAGKTRLGKD